jgi:hypothetical protein
MHSHDAGDMPAGFADMRLVTGADLGIPWAFILGIAYP